MNFLVGLFPYLKRAETSFTVHVCSQDNLEDDSTFVLTVDVGEDPNHTPVES
jgi:hypothetical protein